MCTLPSYADCTYASQKNNLQMIELELNYITQFAVFQAVLSKTSTAWTFNPFSPDGNGVADTTHLTITFNL